MLFRFGPGILLVSMIAACTGIGERDIRKYYFPAEDLRSGQVYEYDLAQGDSSAPEYWYYRSFPRDSGLFLAGTFYDNRFQIGQITREMIDDSGVTAREYSLYEADDATGKQIQTVATIMSPDVYPFRVKDSVGVYVFALQYQPPADPSTMIYITRRRIFLGDAPAFEFKGETYTCIRFGLVESVGTRAGGEELLSGRGEEWYAKNLGLVYYRKSFGDKNQIQREYRLKDVFPMSELEKRAAAFFGESF